jgi:hypothetical protein
MEVHRLSGRLTHRHLQRGVEDRGDDECMEHAVAVGAALDDLAAFRFNARDRPLSIA